MSSAVIARLAGAATSTHLQDRVVVLARNLRAVVPRGVVARLCELARAGPIAYCVSSVAELFRACVYQSVPTDEHARVLTDTEPLYVAVEDRARDVTSPLSNVELAIVNANAPQRMVKLVRSEQKLKAVDPMVVTEADTVRLTRPML